MKIQELKRSLWITLNYNKNLLVTSRKEIMKKFKWMILDNLPTIWVGLVFAFGMILAYSHAGGI